MCQLRARALRAVGVVGFIVLFSIREPFPTLVFDPEADGMALAPVAALFFWVAILYLLDTRRARTDLLQRASGFGFPVEMLAYAEQQPHILQVPQSVPAKMLAEYHWFDQWITDESS